MPNQEELMNEQKRPTARQELLDIQELKPNIARGVQLYLAGGTSIPKIADMLGVNAVTVRSWLKRDDVKKYMVAYQEEEGLLVEAELKSLRLMATRKLMELVDSPIDGVALQAVKDVLDRTGHKPKQEVKKEITIRTYEEKMSDIIDSAIDSDYEVVD